VTCPRFKEAEGLTEKLAKLSSKEESINSWYVGGGSSSSIYAIGTEHLRASSKLGGSSLILP